MKRLIVVILIILGVILLLFAFNIVWKSPAHYKPEKHFTLKVPIMDMETYMNEGSNHRRPYIYTVKSKSGGQVIVLGVRHINDTSNSQFDSIRNYWNTYEPSIALVEGKLGFYFKWIHDPIEKFGESGLTAQLAKNEGLDVSEINHEALKKLEPNVKLNVKGATYYKCDSHTTPHEFMEEMKTHLKNEGVVFFTNEKVEDLEIKSQKISVIKTNKQVLKADEFVLAAGSWSSILSKKLGLKLLLQAGKGYRINSTQQTGILTPAILAEKKIAITPMNGFTRFAGTMEIAGINHSINEVRVEAIANGVKRYYPEIELTKEEKDNAAAGLRPVSPDGVPYIGKSSKCNNLTIATGHAMMGWTMATGTGKLVSEIISEQKTSLEMTNFNPDRKF